MHSGMKGFAFLLMGTVEKDINLNISKRHKGLLRLKKIILIWRRLGLLWHWHQLTYKQAMMLAGKWRSTSLVKVIWVLRSSEVLILSPLHSYKQLCLLGIISPSTCLTVHSNREFLQTQIENKCLFVMQINWPPWHQKTGWRRSQTFSPKAALWCCRYTRTLTDLQPGRIRRQQSNTAMWTTWTDKLNGHHEGFCIQLCSCGVESLLTFP